LKTPLRLFVVIGKLGPPRTRLRSKAVDTKIEDQAGFVQWWKETVDEKRAPRSARTFSMNDAEEQTGISISRSSMRQTTF
jgi:hypothetical protein